MEVLPTLPLTKGPADMFTGDAHFDVICRGEEPTRMRVNVVGSLPAPAPPGTVTR